MAAFFWLWPGLPPSQFCLRKTSVSTGSKRITYLSEFIFHRRDNVVFYHREKYIPGILLPHTNSVSAFVFLDDGHNAITFLFLIFLSQMSM